MKTISFFINRQFIISTLIMSIFSFTGILQIVNAQSKKVKLAGGTIVALRLESSADSEMTEGTIINFRVMRDVTVDDNVLIKQGALATGIISEVSSSSGLGSAGKVQVTLNSVLAVDGQEVFLSGSVDGKGEGKLGLAIILGILCLPLLLITGTDATIPPGREARAYVLQDHQIEVNGVEEVIDVDKID